jgi:hypothetical protein
MIRSMNRVTRRVKLRRDELPELVNNVVHSHGMKQKFDAREIGSRAFPSWKIGQSQFR